jgi:hypothetical protein
VDNDTLIFDTGDVDVLYALDHFRANNIDLMVEISNDYTGQMGNPTENPLGYVEYRDRYFEYRGGSKTLKLSEGFKNNTNAGILFLDFQDQASVTINLLTRRNANLNVPSIYICGSDTTTPHNPIRINAGYVAIEPTDAPTASGKAFMPLGWYFGEKGSATPNEPIVELGSATRLTGGDTDGKQDSGAVFCDAELYTDATHETRVTVNGGTFEHRATSAGNLGDISAFTVTPGGRLVFSGEPIMHEDIDVMGGEVDMSRCIVMTASAGAINMHAGSTWLEPTYVSWGELRFIGCRIQDCIVTLPSNRIVNYGSAP